MLRLCVYLAVMLICGGWLPYLQEVIVSALRGGSVPPDVLMNYRTAWAVQPFLNSALVRAMLQPT